MVRWARRLRRTAGIARRRAIARLPVRDLEVYTPPSLPDPGTGGGKRGAPGWRYRLARSVASAYVAIDRPRRALRTLDERCTSYSLDPDALATIAAACAKTGPDGVTLVDHVGLHRRASPDWPSALRASSIATELAPDDGRHHLGVSTAAQQLAEFDRAIAEARSAARLAPNSPSSWLRLGRSLSARRSNSSATPDDLAAEVGALQRCLALDPNHESARFHLVRVAVAVGDWSAAISAVSQDDEVTPSAFAETGRARLDHRAPDDAGPPSRDWWYVAHAAALHVDDPALAYQLKSRMASQVVEAGGSIHALGLTGFLDMLRARCYLGEHRAALDIVNGTLERTHPTDHRLAFEKLRADILLREGSAVAAGEFLSRHSGIADAAAERRFAALVNGRDIALVGPTSIGSASGEEIDAADVVIRTKFLPDRYRLNPKTQGRRTDISYYTNETVALATDGILDALDRDHIELAVLRPASAPHLERFSRCSDRVRLTPSEDAATFHATHFAIVRILYDVVRYRPASVKVFGVDLFTGRTTYTPGYAFEVDEHFGPGGFVFTQNQAGHDYLDDFRLLTRLVESQLVQVDDTLGEVLSLGEHGYLRTLAVSMGSQRPDPASPSGPG